MQVILDSSFARLGSAPIWGGKKGEFRDWTRWPQMLNLMLNISVRQEPSSGATMKLSKWVKRLQNFFIHIYLASL